MNYATKQVQTTNINLSTKASGKCSPRTARESGAVQTADSTDLDHRSSSSRGISREVAVYKTRKRSWKQQPQLIVVTKRRPCPGRTGSGWHRTAGAELDGESEEEYKWEYMLDERVQQQRQVLVRNTGIVSRKTLWDQLRQLFSDKKLFEAILGVKKIRSHRGACVIALDETTFATTLRILRSRRCRKGLGWIVSIVDDQKTETDNGNKKKGETERKTGGVRKETSRRAGLDPFMLCCNVNGFMTKRTQIEDFVAGREPLFIAIQETKLTEKNYAPRIQGYQILHDQCVAGETGQNGLLLAIRDDITAFEDKGVSNVIKAARVYGLQKAGCPGSENTPWIVGSVYRCPTRPFAGGFLLEIKRWLSNHLNDHRPIVLAGDFNLTEKQIRRKLSQWNFDSDWDLLRVSGSSLTHRRRGKPISDIDHILINKQAGMRLRVARVDRTFDISDHYGIWVYGRERLITHTGADEPTMVRFDRARIREMTSTTPSLLPTTITQSGTGENHFEQADNRLSRWADDNKWNILLDQTDDMNVEEMTREFIQTTKDVSKEMGLTTNSEPIRKFGPRHLPKNIKEVVDKRRRCSVKLAAASGDDYERLSEEYKRLSKESKMSIRTHNRLSFSKYIENGSRYFANGNARSGWQWLKNISGKRLQTSSDSRVIPLRNHRDEMEYRHSEILNIHGQHYASLASDPTQTSLNKDYWAAIIGPPTGPEWSEVSETPSWQDVRTAISSMLNNKAAGNDGIPAELYKAFVLPETSCPEMAAAKVLMQLVLKIWQEGIPEAWQEATIVSIPKKGDLSDIANYRGIALINIGVKILCKIMANRIQRAVEERHFLRPEQFGFRRKEECASLYIAVLETCQRRKMLMKEDTYLAFLDIQKAYDTVPTYALLCKLERIGIGGRALKFIENLYLTSKARVRVGNSYSDPFCAQRGVRQGCPMSPVLFNVFINDLLDDMVANGVKVVGTATVFCGGLFADDACLIAGTPEQLQDSLDKATIWAEKYQMAFGIKKCGVLCVKGSERTDASVDPIPFTLQNQRVPVVPSYRYLGIEFNSELDTNKTIQERTQRIKRLAVVYYPFLSLRLIPIHIRVTFLKSVILSILTYGGELLGTNKEEANIVETLVSELVSKMIKPLGSCKKLDIYASRVELNLPVLAGKFAHIRLKSYLKWKGAKTLVSRVLQPYSAPTKSKHTWLKKTLRLVNRLKHFEIIKDNNVHRYDKQGIYDLYNSSHGGKSEFAIAYRDGNFGKSRHWVKDTIYYPKLGVGANWLMRVRIMGTWNPYTAASAELIPQTWKNFCVCCQREGPNDLAHVIVDCVAFDTIRAELDLTRIIESLKSRVSLVDITEGGASSENISKILLGGSISGVSWNDFCEATSQEGCGFSSVAGWVTMSCFLLRAMPIMQGTMWSLRDRPEPARASDSLQLRLGGPSTASDSSSRDDENVAIVLEADRILCVTIPNVPTPISGMVGPDGRPLESVFTEEGGILAEVYGTVAQLVVFLMLLLASSPRQNRPRSVE